MILDESSRYGSKSAEILLESLLVLCVTTVIGGTLPKGGLAYPVGIGAAVINLLRIWFSEPMKKGFDWMFRWRWAIALGVFVLMVAFQLHTSNSGAYAEVLDPGPGVEQSILFGSPKAFRTDEYAVQLPYYFSQFYNNFDQISYQLSIGGQDMIVGYNAPVLSPTLIGKPFVWGYILFGNAYGISWYFSSKIILMFMSAIELFLIVTRKKMLSVFGAFLLTFAPAMQWWFSPHFYDVLFWACVLFDVGYWFFMAQGWKKWLFTLLAISSLTGFTLALFPSLQVPCGLLMLALMIACLVRDRKQLRWKKTDLLNVAAVIIGVAAVLLPALISMKDALELLSNTAYPGSRVSVGGYGKDWMLFLNIASIFQPFAEPMLLNNSEISSFTHFAIAFLLFYPYLWYWMKKAGKAQRYVGDVLVFFLLIQLIFLLVPLPEWLAKMTLLSYANRMQIVFGLTGTIFTVWSFAMIETTEMPHKKLAGALVCLAYGILSWPTVAPMLLPGFMRIVHYKEIFYAMAVAMAAGLWLVFTNWRQLFYCILICWTAVSGLLVNPLMQGTASVTDYPFIDAVRAEVEDNPDALWLSTGYDQIQGLLLANGARVFNAVSFYPDFEKWKLIDPDLDHYRAENRYAHIQVTLTGNEKSRIRLVSNDLIQLEVTPGDLKKMGIRYFTGNQAQREILDLFEIPYTILFADAQNGDMIFDLEPDKRAQEAADPNRLDGQTQTDSAETSASSETSDSRKEESGQSDLQDQDREKTEERSESRQSRQKDSQNSQSTDSAFSSDSPADRPNEQDARPI